MTGRKLIDRMATLAVRTAGALIGLAVFSAIDQLLRFAVVGEFSLASAFVALRIAAAVVAFAIIILVVLLCIPLKKGAKP